MNNQTLVQALLSLPNEAQETIVDKLFVPNFLNSIGFSLMETVPKFATGNGSDTVDYAARHNTEDDIFISSKFNPYLLLELKGRDVNLSEGTAQYKLAVEQIKRYLLSQNCLTVKWGIITNSKHIQLFRKHGKVIHPASPCLAIDSNNINEIVKDIRQKIDLTTRALTVAIYNNKGGVGKTTTTVNLAAALTLIGKKTLIVDFDLNQQDLTHSLGIKPSKDRFYSSLEDKNNTDILQEAIHSYILQVKDKRLIFDIIPADKKLLDMDDSDLRKIFKISRLSQILNNLKSESDYILIDSPPNWRFMSQSAIYAADVVLIPTKHNSIFSLENAAIAIQNFIPQIQQIRKDGGPIALPIFFNGEKMTEAQEFTVYQAIDNIIEQARKDKDNKFDLLPYFYPRYTQTRKDRHIFELPSYAHIANAAFSHLPAAYKNKIARDYYLALVKEYFLQ